MMKKTVIIVLFTLLPLVCAHLYILQNSLVQPINIVERQTLTMAKLQSIGITSDTEKIAKAIEIASKQSGLSEDFLIALVYTESTCKITAVSSKGYHGLGQIKPKVFYPDANLLISAYTFNDKMRLANRDLILALCLYKGYGGATERGVQQAKKVLALRDRLKRIEV